jgi:4-hydroxy-3-polyprenylbenzoate decarboxylase
VPPTLRTILDNTPIIRRFLNARPKAALRAASQEVALTPDLDSLPVQVCWPDDGGRFITYGQVCTYDPRDGKRNIGLYRMHVFDHRTTGMHWQIQKGGGFHYFQAERMNRGLEIAVALGTSPALLFATIAALPEGIDEAMFAGFLQNRRVEFTRGKTVAIDVPADAEFVLEGVVPARERRMEGPFGDHFGHYSAASEFPVFHLTALTHRRNPIYPAIVVGKPPMEDKFLGDATQQILGPLAKLIHKEVTNLWAYYEAGFHNLLVVAIDQRYQKEAIKAALGLMGTDQLSLTKCIVAVAADVDVRDWHAVVREIRDHFDPHHDFIMIPKVPLDTLDFTSYRMNLGSKMIIDATRKPGRGAKPAPPDVDLARVRELDRRILDAAVVDGALLVVKLDGTLADSPGDGPTAGMTVVRKLIAMPGLAGLTAAAVVSEDVDIHDKESYIWGIFTRFDCERDVLFTDNELRGISPVYRGIMGIDATWKPGYPKPLVMPEEIRRRVDEKWGAIWKNH